jgi:putative membrane protein
LKTVLHPVNKLAVIRTVLANERTLLSYLRTSLGCLIGGAGLIKFFTHPLYVIGGSVLIVFSAVWLLVGIRRFWKTRKLIQNIDLEDWLDIEGFTKKQPNID